MKKEIAGKSGIRIVIKLLAWDPAHHDAPRKQSSLKKVTLSAMSSIPFVVNTTLAPAFSSFSMFSFVMSDSLLR